MHRRRHRSILTSVIVAMFLAASPAAAQEISGRVVEDATNAPLSGVHIVLLDEDQRRHDETFSDPEGRFDLSVPRDGRWIIAAALIGYASVDSEPVEVATDEEVVVEIRMNVEAVPVDPVVVTSRISHENADIQAFYRRMEQGEASGIGRFISRADVERSRASEPSGLLRTVPGVRVNRRPSSQGSRTIIRMSSGCVPAIYIDGTQINRLRYDDSLDDFLSASAIEGIEVYRGAGQQVGRFNDDRGCGLILVWTRRGSLQGEPPTWTRFIVGASLLLAVFLLR